ncbi:hypothetical protein GRAN_2178 [Granulicella sibirica]|uniref:Uncharacterized protein n=1 Tax=Granulicella sibirica TaxID=2479048 RepID=A0A4Q0T9T0_9BACT|nr:hypothetical protein GRAN_2178 [Granulicella sibirica]
MFYFFVYCCHDFLLMLSKSSNLRCVLQNTRCTKINDTERLGECKAKGPTTWVGTCRFGTSWERFSLGRVDAD